MNTASSTQRRRQPQLSQLLSKLLDDLPDATSHAYRALVGALLQGRRA